MITVLKDTDGMYKLFQDKITQAYVNPPENLMANPARYSMTTFVSEERVRMALGGAEVAVIDKSPPNNDTVVPPVSDADLEKYLTPKEREFMQSSVGCSPPGSIARVDNFYDPKIEVLSGHQVNYTDLNIKTNLLNMAWECCSTRNKKQKESRRIYLIGYLDGIEKLSNSDEYRLQVLQIFDKHGMNLFRED